MKAVIRHQWARASIDIYLYDESGGTFNWAKPTEIVFDKGDCPSNSCSRLPDQPTFSFHPEEWRELCRSITEALDDNVGIIPEIPGSAKELKAVKFHLEDMRALVFKREPK